jgi:hypothetical protein
MKNKPVLSYLVTGIKDVLNNQNHYECQYAKNMCKNSMILYDCSFPISFSVTLNHGWNVIQELSWN